MAYLEVQTVDGEHHAFNDVAVEFDKAILQATTTAGVTHTFPLANVLRFVTEAST